MDFLLGKNLIYKETELLDAGTALKKKTLILYYFTAENCDACRLFDPLLREVYNEALFRRVEMAIIIVSSDPDNETFLDNLSTNYSEWFAIPFDDELNQILVYNYGITSIPNLVVVRKNGALVTKEGKTDVEKIGINVLVTWSE